MDALYANKNERLQSLLGSSASPAVLGQMADSGLGNRLNVQLRAHEGSGYLGSDRTAEDQQRFMAGAMAAGVAPNQSAGLLSIGQPQEQKPTTLEQQFNWFNAQDKPTQDKIMEYKKAGAQTINVGTNMKPPTGYRFLNPDNPQSSPVEPVPGGPATRGTGAQQKQIAAFEGIRGMVNAMQGGLKDGVNPNSLSATTTGMLKSVPVLAGLWEGFNGDAKKEAVFLNETENFGNTALQIMRGAQVGPAEQERFERSLPTKGMTAEQYENALNTSIRIFNDSMRSTMEQVGGGQQFNPISGSDLFTEDKATRLEALRRKRDGAN